MKKKFYQLAKIEDGKTKLKWICEITIPGSNVKRRKVCKGCATLEEAEKFIFDLLNQDNVFLISYLAKDMYKPGSEHLKRLADFGKVLCEKTLVDKRHYIELIIKDFGSKKINELSLKEIESFLVKDKNHSGSWKNSYLETFGAIYDETLWKCPYQVPKPKFQRFIRNSKKADILTTAELKDLFAEDSWNVYRDYLFFKIIISCGLRLGEARALRYNQFLLDDKVLIVNGFCKKNGRRTNYNKTGSDENKRYRITPLPDDIIELVQNWYNSQKIKEYDFLFTDEYGKPIAQEFAEKQFKNQLNKTGIRINNRKLVPHSLRYTYITRMRRDLPLEVVQKIAGHSDQHMTEYYTRSGLREMIDSIQNYIPAANGLFK